MSHPRKPASQGDWLSLTDLGRLYGISAVQTGRLLAEAGLRRSGGEASARALSQGLAMRQHPGHHQVTLWNRQGCGALIEGQGMMPLRQPTLISLWADLLSALQQGSPSISVSAEEMADDMPHDLVKPVNRELRQRGCSFQVKLPFRSAAGLQPACSLAPAAGAAGPHRRD